MKQNSDAGHGKCLTSVREVEHGSAAVIVAGEGYREQGEDGNIKSPVQRTKYVEQLARPAYKTVMNASLWLAPPQNIQMRLASSTGWVRDRWGR